MRRFAGSFLALLGITTLSTITAIRTLETLIWSFERFGTTATMTGAVVIISAFAAAVMTWRKA